MAPCNSSLPTFSESLKVLTALVMYLRIWVASWVATQLLAPKKIKAKHNTRKNTLPRSVTQGGKPRSRWGPPGRRPEPPPEPAGFLRRTGGADLWDLRSKQPPYHVDKARLIQESSPESLLKRRRPCCGRGGTRTPTSSRTLDPEPSASTNSATRPWFDPLPALAGPEKPGGFYQARRRKTTLPPGPLPAMLSAARVRSATKPVLQALCGVQAFAGLLVTKGPRRAIE